MQAHWSSADLGLVHWKLLLAKISTVGTVLDSCHNSGNYLETISSFKTLEEEALPFLGWIEDLLYIGQEVAFHLKRDNFEEALIDLDNLMQEAFLKVDIDSNSFQIL